MGHIGDTISTAVPGVGSTGTAYATDVNAILDEVIARLEELVPIPSIAAAQPGEYLDLNGQSILAVGELVLQDNGGVSSTAGSLQRYNGNFYYVDVFGAVQITDGDQLNAAALGGITGDFSGSNARVNYVAATSTFEFWSDEGNGDWAHIKADRADLVDQATGRYVRVQAPATISATYSLVLPPAPPASLVSALSIDSSGNLKLVENAPVTNGYRHGEDTQWYTPGQLGYVLTVGTASQPSPTNAELSATSAAATMGGFFSVPKGRRLKSVTLRVSKSSASGTRDVNVTLRKQTDGSGASVGTATTTLTTAALTSMVVTPSPIAAAADYETYSLEVAFTAGSGSPGVGIWHGLAVTWDYV